MKKKLFDIWLEEYGQEEVVMDLGLLGANGILTNFEDWLLREGYLHEEGYPEEENQPNDPAKDNIILIF